MSSRNVVVWVALLGLAACHGEHGAEAAHGGEGGHGAGEHGAEGAHGHDDDSPGGVPGLSFTHVTDRTELFVELPALVLGHAAPFAAHLTDLAEAGPVTRGTVVVVLSGDGADERFEAGPSEVKGIFRPVATPARAGARQLAVVHLSERGEDRHDLGTVVVHPTVEAAREAAPVEGPRGGIAFLKEQQWKVPFATTAVGEGTVREGVPALGTLRPRPEGESLVTAPVAGALLAAGDSFPRVGQEVARGQVLARVVPRLQGADVATLEQAGSRGRVALEQARRERERLEGLLAAGAVAERRVVEARLAEQAARADVEAAARRLDHYRGLEPPAGGPAGGAVELRASVGGVVVAARATAGAYVDEGTLLFHVVDLDRLWLEVRVPEADFGRVRAATGAVVQVEGFASPFEIDGATGGQVVAIGGLVDPDTRTAPLIFEFPNPGGQVPAGAHARVRLLTGRTATGLVIPTSALQEEGGLDTVFVQVTGESFERRTVRLGLRDGARVQVLDGLAVGERVVSTGAYLVRLAASSSAIPAHGHAH